METAPRAGPPAGGEAFLRDRYSLCTFKCFRADRGSYGFCPIAKTEFPVVSTIENKSLQSKCASSGDDAVKASGSDLELQRRVVSFLADSNMPGLRQLKVHAADGTVTLHGTVRTYYEKQLSQQRCKRVAGVIRLIDEVEVSN